MTFRAMGLRAGRGLRFWVQDPEWFSLEIGRDVFDSVTIEYSVLVFSYVANVRDQKRVVQQGEWVSRW